MSARSCRRLYSLRSAGVPSSIRISVLRFWLNNGGVNTTATNNKFLGEIAMPAQAVTALATGTLPEYIKTLGISIPAGYKIYVGATVAAGGVLAFLADVNGGDY